MSNIQMFLALGASVLLGFIIINFNKNSLLTEDLLYDSNFGITATTIASSIIEDAGKKRFDNVYYVGDSVVTDVSNFTLAENLGVDTGEDALNPTTFNDFDDYKGYFGVDSTMPSAIFSFYCDVCYVNPGTLDIPISTQSWHKKISVKVWSTTMKDTIFISSIFSYLAD